MSSEFDFGRMVKKPSENELRRNALDLEPWRWKSDRPKKREPMFGEGALPLLGEMLIGACLIGLFILIATWGAALKEQVYTLLYGEQPHASQPMAPGETRIINGLTIRRID